MSNQDNTEITCRKFLMPQNPVVMGITLITNLALAIVVGVRKYENISDDFLANILLILHVILAWIWILVMTSRTVYGYCSSFFILLFTAIPFWIYFAEVTDFVGYAIGSIMISVILIPWIATLEEKIKSDLEMVDRRYQLQMAAFNKEATNYRSHRIRRKRRRLKGSKQQKHNT